MSYGYCPHCGADGMSRERRPNGKDTCRNGCVYPSKKALDKPPFGIAPGGAGKLELSPMSKFLPDPTEIKGPLAIAVPDHTKAEDLAFLLGFRDDPYDQGVRVIPFAASALGYCGPGTKLFRGIVSVPPRPGQGVSREAFDRWVEMAIVPYAEPGCQRIVL